MRNSYKGSKTEFDKLYVGKCQLEHQEVKISTDILYRKWTAYRNNDIEDLIDKRGAWNRGKSKIPAPVWDFFLWSWLDENQPTASLCYRDKLNPSARAVFDQAKAEYGGETLASGTTEITAKAGDIIEIVKVESNKITSVAYVTVKASDLK